MRPRPRSAARVLLCTVTALPAAAAALVADATSLPLLLEEAEAAELAEA